MVCKSSMYNPALKRTSLWCPEWHRSTKRAFQMDCSPERMKWEGHTVSAVWYTRTVCPHCGSLPGIQTQENAIMYIGAYGLSDTDETRWGEGGLTKAVQNIVWLLPSAICMYSIKRWLGKCSKALMCPMHVLIKFGQLCSISITRFLLILAINIEQRRLLLHWQQKALWMCSTNQSLQSGTCRLDDGSWL